MDSSDNINLLTRAISTDKTAETTETTDKPTGKKFKNIPPPFGKAAVAPNGDLEKSFKAYESLIKQIERIASKSSKRAIIYARTKLNEFVGYISSNSQRAVWVRQHQSRAADTTNTWIGTVGLVSCSALVYIHENIVVLGHFYPADPWQQTGVFQGVEHVSMADQLNRFWAAMQSVSLHGQEANGRWFLITPVDSQQPPQNLYWQNGHQQIAAWVAGIAGSQALSYGGYHLTPEQLLRNARDNMQDGFGVVYAIHGKLYYGNDKIYDPNPQVPGWRGVLNRILGSST